MSNEYHYSRKASKRMSYLIHITLTVLLNFQTDVQKHRNSEPHNILSTINNSELGINKNIFYKYVEIEEILIFIRRKTKHYC